MAPAKTRRCLAWNAPREGTKLEAPGNLPNGMLNKARSRCAAATWHQASSGIDNAASRSQSSSAIPWPDSRRQPGNAELDGYLAGGERPRLYPGDSNLRIM
jgi:hypothetical protein